MSLEDALWLANKGFHVFPLRANSKLPAIKDFPNQASLSPDKIKSWWIDELLGTEKPYNIGISTTHFGTNQALVVVDVDNKGDKQGSQVLRNMDKKLPDTFMQVTPTGGEHWVYIHNTPVKQGVDVLGRGLDIRSKGGYIVGHGSIINGKKYLGDIDGGPAACPQWIIDRCNVARSKELVTRIAKRAMNIDLTMAKTRALDYLKTAPVSVEGDGGDQTCYAVACRLKDIGCDIDTAAELMFEGDWNEKCEPPWSAEELKN